MKVSYAGVERARLQYNGLGWLTVKQSDAAYPPSGVLNQQRVRYYDASWRLIEERVNDDLDANSIDDRTTQMIWGPRYIDDAVSLREDANQDGDYSDPGDSQWWPLTDAQFSVVALVDAAGALVERTLYSPYGAARHHYAEDVDGDGDVDTADQAVITGAASGKRIEDVGYVVEADVNRDAVIDSADLAIVQAKAGFGALPDGWTSLPNFAGGPDSQIAYDGYTFNQETLLYSVRHRTYDPAIGRWLERDPAMFIDGSNLYCYGREDPVSTADAFGLACSGICRDCTTCTSQSSRNGCCNTKEKVECVLRWGVGTCLETSRLADDALNETNTRFPFPRLRNGPADAWRHCFWSCNMQKLFGGSPINNGSVAKGIGCNHEDAGRCAGQPPATGSMDKCNNQVGRVIAGISGTCADLCTWALNTGQLQQSLTQRCPFDISPCP